MKSRKPVEIGECLLDILMQGQKISDSGQVSNLVALYSTAYQPRLNCTKRALLLHSPRAFWELAAGGLAGLVLGGR